MILFTVYLLLDPRRGKRNAKPEKPSRTDMLILEYIKGKARGSCVGELSRPPLPHATRGDLTYSRDDGVMMGSSDHLII